MHFCIFYLEHVKVVWGHSVHFSENWAVTQKTAHRRVKGTKMWISEVYVTCMLVFFYIDHVKIIWGHPLYFSENWAVTYPVSHQLGTVHLGSSTQEILSPT